MKKIALDVDGVLFNFMPDFDKAAAHVLGCEINVQQDEYKMDYYHLAKRVNTTQEKVNDILNYMLESRMYAKLQAFEGVKEALKTIEEAGYEIYVVTALPESAREMRLENLKNELGLVPKHMYCVGMGMSKADAIKELGPDVFIDDRIGYLADAKNVYHTAWVDQKESQEDKETQVDVHVHSLAEWVEKHLPRVTRKLDRFYGLEGPLQGDLKLESVKRKYSL